MPSLDMFRLGIRLNMPVGQTAPVSAFPIAHMEAAEASAPVGAIPITPQQIHIAGLFLNPAVCTIADSHPTRIEIVDELLKRKG